MDTKTIPTLEETRALVAKFHRGEASVDEKVLFMRGAVFQGALAKGKSQAEAATLALSPDAERYGKNLSVVVE